MHSGEQSDNLKTSITHQVLMKYFFFLALLIMAVQVVQAAPLGIYKPLRPGTQDFLRLQDFSIFRQGGHIFTAPMMKDFSGQGIPVARSLDYNVWEELGRAVSTRTAEDSSMVWAPHVVEDNGTYHMFYTGVTQPAPGMWCQRILVASTTDPTNAANWQRNYNVQFIVNGQTQSWFRPSHPGAIWSDNTWADCRDAMVMKRGNTWYMYYSGNDVGGAICGVATAPSVLGPWTDQGAVLKVGVGIPESCYVLEAPDNTFVMTFNHAAAGAEGGSKIAKSNSLVPVNGQPVFDDLRLMTEAGDDQVIGWAQEWLPGPDGELLAAYLTGYWVNFEQAYWRWNGDHWQIVNKPQGDGLVAAKALPDNTWFTLKGHIISAVFASESVFYIQNGDRSSGLRVSGPTNGLAVGMKVDIAGRMGSRFQSGKLAERMLTASSITILENGLLPEPLNMNTRTIGGEPRPPYEPGVMNGIGLNNLGLLVSVTGKVTYVSGSLLWLDDGQGIQETNNRVGIMVRAPSSISGIAVGDMVTVSGIVEGNIPVNAPTNRRTVRLRTISDLVKL